MPVVQAVATATISDVPGLGEAMQRAETAAVEQFLAAGGSVADAEAILAAKAQARAEVLSSWNQ